MGTLRARIWSDVTGEPLAGRVRVVASSGEYFAPGAVVREPETGQRSFPEALWKVGPGEPFFYTDGAFEIDLPPGQTDVIVERGTEWERQRMSVDIPARGALEVDVRLVRWPRLLGPEWRAGNTHVHYDHREKRAEERLRREPSAEDVPVLIVSMVERESYAYASNTLGIGRHPASTTEHPIDIGEEIRHNRTEFGVGYGHLLLFNLTDYVRPISRGVLHRPGSPDYPPLSDGCDAAHAQGGLVFALHNGTGIEIPVAAIHRRIDGMNLFDPWWLEAEYQVWYRLLNCGIRLPASTGSDWQFSSSGRVYVNVQGNFTYETWLEGLRQGRTFATNGPILLVTVGDAAPSNATVTPAGAVRATVEWESDKPIDYIELVADGKVLGRADNHEPESRGSLSAVVRPDAAGWIAARCYGATRTSFEQPRWAHTSPVYLRERPLAAPARDAARFFGDGIDESLEWLRTEARFETDDQRRRIIDLFGDAAARFAAIAKA